MLFGAMLAALSTVYDKESGVMRMLVIAPFEHYWIVIAKVLGAAIAGIIQAVLLLVLLALFGYLGSDIHWGVLLLALLMTALACASLGILTAAWTPTLDNYAVIMNLVIFPVFFLSGSLYPVAQLAGCPANHRERQSLHLRRRPAQARESLHDRPWLRARLLDHDQRRRSSPRSSCSPPVSPACGSRRSRVTRRSSTCWRRRGAGDPPPF